MQSLQETCEQLKIMRQQLAEMQNQSTALWWTVAIYGIQAFIAFIVLLIIFWQFNNNKKQLSELEKQATASQSQANAAEGQLRVIESQVQSAQAQLRLIENQVTAAQGQVAAAEEQTKEIKKSIDESVSSRAIGYIGEVMKYFDKYPHIAHAFNIENDYYKKLKLKNKQIYDFLGLMLGFYEPLWRLHEGGRMNDAAWNAWERWLRERVLKMRQFDDFWRREAQFYGEDFVGFINQVRNNQPQKTNWLTKILKIFTQQRVSP